MVVATQRDKIMLMVLMEMPDKACFVCQRLMRYMMDIFSNIPTDHTLGHIEVFVVLASFFLFHQKL